MNNFIKTDLLDNVIELQLNVLIFQQGDYFVALCPSLNLSSYGDSLEDAKVAFDEAVADYIEYAQENDTLSQDLVNNGWSINLHNNHQALPPKEIPLDIPAGLLRSQYNQNYTLQA